MILICYHCSGNAAFDIIKSPFNLGLAHKVCICSENESWIIPRERSDLHLTSTVSKTSCFFHFTCWSAAQSKRKYRIPTEHNEHIQCMFFNISSQTEKRAATGRQLLTVMGNSDSVMKLYGGYGKQRAIVSYLTRQ